MEGPIWSLVVIVGPILLGVVIFWALLRNRRTSPQQDARTEAATHELYDRIDRDDKEHRPKAER